MDGYLLDTNTVDYWFDPKRPEHPRVLARIGSLPAGTPLLISVISLGEIEYGHAAVSGGQTPVQANHMDFVRQHFPLALAILESTASCYGDLRARLFERFGPATRKQGLRPEQLRDPLTARELGFQENDLWIAAQAIEHNLVLATHDRMGRIQEVARGRLRVEDWAR